MSFANPLDLLLYSRATYVASPLCYFAMLWRLLRAETLLTVLSQSYHTIAGDSPREVSQSAAQS